jgi:hypothetical protein
MFDNSTFGNYQSAVPYTRPQAFMPQQMRRPQISGDQLIKVTGNAGVNALANAMDANSRVAAFDANDDILYVVTTDGAAYPTVQAFRFSPYVQPGPEPEKEPVYRDEFDSFKNELREAMENVKQLIQSKPNRSTAAAEPAGE